MNRTLLFSGDTVTSPSSVTLSNPFSNYEWLEVVIFYSNAYFARLIDCQLLSNLLGTNGECTTRPDIATSSSTAWSFKVTSTTEFIHTLGSLPLVAIYGVSFN